MASTLRSKRDFASCKVSSSSLDRGDEVLADDSLRLRRALRADVCLPVPSGSPDG